MQHKILENFYISRFSMLRNINFKEIDKTLVYEKQLHKKIKHPILIIGEAPGSKEVENGMPFCGPSGKNLESLLEENNLSREKDLIITNIFPFRTFEDGFFGKKNRTPNKQELEEGSRLILKEIEIIKPSLILLLGNTAYNGFKKIVPEIKSLKINGFKKYKIGEKEYLIGKSHHPSPLSFNRGYIRTELKDFFSEVKKKTL